MTMKNEIRGFGKTKEDEPILEELQQGLFDIIWTKIRLNLVGFEWVYWGF